MKIKIVLLVLIAIVLAGAILAMALAARGNDAQTNKGTHSGEYCWSDTNWDWGPGCFTWVNYWHSVKTSSGTWKYFIDWQIQFGESSFDWEWWDYNYEEGIAGGKWEHVPEQDKGNHIIWVSESVVEDNGLWMAEWLDYGIDCAISYRYADGKIKSTSFECSDA